MRKPAWLYVRLTKIVGRGKHAKSETLENKVSLLGFTEIRREDMSEKKLTGEVGFTIDEKLNDVFGPYTSLGVGISLKFTADVNSFEAEIDKFLRRADKKVKDSMNIIAQQSGVKVPWGSGKPEQKG